MKIKVGQYARLDNGKIVKIVKVSAKIENAWFMCEVDIYSQSMITKVANTPQELIEVGDLVAIKQSVSLYCKGERFTVVEGLFEDGIQHSSIDDGETMYRTPFKNITKILTPNSNGGYDLQWEAE